MAWGSWGKARLGQGCRCLTRKTIKECPELHNVRGESDVSVQDDDSGQAERQDAGKYELHQPIQARVVLVGDPGDQGLYRGGGEQSKWHS